MQRHACRLPLRPAHACLQPPFPRGARAEHALMAKCGQVRLQMRAVRRLRPLPRSRARRRRKRASCGGAAQERAFRARRLRQRGHPLPAVRDGCAVPVSWGPSEPAYRQRCGRRGGRRSERGSLGARGERTHTCVAVAGAARALAQRAAARVCAHPRGQCWRRSWDRGCHPLAQARSVGPTSRAAASPA